MGAHNGQLFNPNEVKRTEYKNIDQLTNERSNISYQMSSEDQEYYHNKKLEEDRNEEQRQQRINERDNMVENQYNTINNLFLK